MLGVLKMANPIKQLVNNAHTSSVGGMDIGSLVRQFNQFKSMFKGNPKDIVMKMLSDGKITQQQLDNAKSIASKFGGILK